MVVVSFAVLDASASLRPRRSSPHAAPASPHPPLTQPPPPHRRQPYVQGREGHHDERTRDVDHAERARWLKRQREKGREAGNRDACSRRGAPDAALSLSSTSVVRRRSTQRPTPHYLQINTTRTRTHKPTLPRAPVSLCPKNSKKKWRPATRTITATALRRSTPRSPRASSRPSTRSPPLAARSRASTWTARCVRFGGGGGGGERGSGRALVTRKRRRGQKRSLSPPPPPADLEKNLLKINPKKSLIHLQSKPIGLGKTVPRVQPPHPLHRHRHRRRPHLCARQAQGWAPHRLRGRPCRPRAGRSKARVQPARGRAPRRRHGWACGC